MNFPCCLNPACAHPYNDHLPVCVSCSCERFIFPALNAPVQECSDVCAVDVMRSMLSRAENDPDCPEAIMRLAPLVRKTLDAVAIPEIETVQ